MYHIGFCYTSKMEKPLSNLPKKSRKLALATAAALSMATPSQTSEADLELRPVFSETLNEVPQVSVFEAGNGNKIYYHEDLETTEILNYLAGVGEVTEAHVAAGLRRDFFAALRRAGEDTNSAEVRDYIYSIDTREEIRDFYKKYFHVFPETKEWFGDDPEGYADFRFDDLKQLDESIIHSADEDLYEALWEVFIQAGAPRIEWVDTAAERSKRKDSEYGGSNYFRYKDEHGDAVVYIDRSYKSDKALAVFLDELAHSFSFHTNPERFFEGRKAVHEYKEGKDLEDPKVRRQVNQFYLEPGNEEYLAHQVIFPKLISYIGQYHPSMSKYLEDHQENYERMAELQKEQKSIE